MQSNVTATTGTGLEQVVAAAVRAPSVHNTQPWRFRVDPAAGVLQVRADRSRLLDAMDPEGRELTLSCGAALGYAEVALAAQGVEHTTTLLPDPADPDLLAEVRLGGRREASADGAAREASADGAAREASADGAAREASADGATREPSADEAALAAATGTRATWRGRTTDQPVPDDAVAAMEDEASRAGATVLEMTGETWVRAAVLHSHATAVQEADPAYHAELAEWTSRQPDAWDGVPRQAQTPRGQAPRSTFTLREFDETGEGGLAAGDPRPEHPRILLLGTEHDGPADWLTAGRAFARLALRAEVLDLRTSPLTQLTEVPGARGQLRRLAGGTAWPQVLVRVGYGDRAPVTPRRPVDDVMDVVGGGA